MNIFDNFNLLVLYSTYFVYSKLFWLGLLSGAFLLALNAEKESAWKVFYIVLGAFSLPPAIAYSLIPTLAKIADINGSSSSKYFFVWMGLCVLSWIGAVWWMRVGVQKLDELKKKVKRTTRLERDRLTDIRDIGKHLPADKKRFDPLKYIDFKKGYFIGLSENDKPIYISENDWETSHVLLSGRTRSGKGVAAQIIGAQSICKKELFVVLDPRCDNWMPHIYKSECEKAGQPYVFLDLRQSAHPQINMFENCTAEVIENMLIAAFGLAPKGDNADAYRQMDRKAARQTARYISTHPTATPKEILTAMEGQWRDDSQGLSANGFAESLSEMAELPAVNRKSGGIDIDKLVESGGCLYVVGDMMNPRIIMMQRMILIRLLMITKNRKQTDDMKIIRVFADEFRVHISRPFIVSLGASAGWKLLSILAFQSFEDLRDCPADLDAEMVRGAVMENCALQLSYRIKDDQTAEALAAATGKILVDVESKGVEKNLAQSETLDGERRITQCERFLIDTNMIKRLPIPDPKLGTIGCGVFMGTHTAQFCFTSPILVERSDAAITPTIEPQSDEEAKQDAEASKTAADRVAELGELDDALVPPAPGLVLDEATGRWKRPPKNRNQDQQ